MTLFYSTVKKNHYSSTEGHPNYKSAEDLYAEMGINYDALIKQSAEYQNTCAARMSLALLKSGASFAGRIQIKTGKYKGKKIEPGAKRLADELNKIVGKVVPYKVTLSDNTPFYVERSKAEGALTGKRGIVYFHKIDGYGGGHIDVIDVKNKQSVCNSNCYFECEQVWFWPLAEAINKKP